MSLRIPEKLADVTPSDSVNFSNSGILFVGVGGDVSVEGAQAGSAIIFKNVPNGSFLWARVKRVNSTGTTATNVIVAW